MTPVTLKEFLAMPACDKLFVYDHFCESIVMTTDLIGGLPVEDMRKAVWPDITEQVFDLMVKTLVDSGRISLVDGKLMAYKHG